MSVIAIPLPYVITIKYKIPKRPDQNIRLYLYLASFSLLLFIFLIMFSLSLLFLSLVLHLPHRVLSFSLSLLFSLLLFIRFYLSPLSLFGHGGPLSLLFLSLFVWLVFLICTVLLFFFFSYIIIVVNLYNTGFCVYWFFNLYNTGFFFFLYNHCF